MNNIKDILRNTLIPAVLAVTAFSSTVNAQVDPYAEPEEPGLPPSNMVLDLPRPAAISPLIS